MKRKNQAAVSLGRKGGKNSRANLTPELRRELAQRAAAARWVCFACGGRLWPEDKTVIVDGGRVHDTCRDVAARREKNAVRIVAVHHSPTTERVHAKQDDILKAKFAAQTKRKQAKQFDTGSVSDR